ncbi:MAG: hypothetical protein Q8O09_06150 [Bacillota bacterium]|nr:hypothetical protein [Bacillota bacterium]
MDIDDAGKIIFAYGGALQVKPEYGLFRKSSLLPCSKDDILKAAKLLIALKIEVRQWNDEWRDSMEGALCFLPNFHDDKEVDYINRISRIWFEGKIKKDDLQFTNWKKRMDELFKESKEFQEKIIDKELDNFIRDVENLDRKDYLYHQRIYTLIGLEYSPQIEKIYERKYLK